MTSDSLYKYYHQHLELIQEKNIVSLEGDYICPLCLQSFSVSDIGTEIITLEHVPQKSLGGKAIALTCKNCNNDSGTSIDSNLYHFLQQVEFREQIMGASQKGRADSTHGTIQSTLECKENEMVLKISAKNNDSRIKNYLDKLFKKNEVFVFKGSKIKYNSRNVSAAILKNAYIILFTYIGYPVICNKKYNILRDFIKNPDGFFLPEPLWRIFPSLPVEDGVYQSQNDKFKGYVVIYTLKLNREHRVLVLIPSISNTFNKVASFLRPLKIGSILVLSRLDKNDDLLFNEKRIQEMISWSKSWKKEVY